jgi:hypothetical protein
MSEMNIVKRVLFLKKGGKEAIKKEKTEEDSKQI